MAKDLVSVVVPIYKVEKYLDRCVKSIINQSYRELEIILVDDGSPDNCPAMCDAWAEKDSRIKVVHKKNAGLGMARNSGIDNATGAYICFFDSDDYIATDTVEKCMAAAKAENADIVTYGMHRVNPAGNVVSAVIPNVKKSVFSGREIQDVFLADMVSADPDGGGNTGLCMSACASLFSMEMIGRRNWRFVSEREIISEDAYSLLNLYKDVEKVVVLQEAFYYYCLNEGSLTQSYRPDRYKKIKHFYMESLTLCDGLEYNDVVRRRLARLFIAFSIAAMKQAAVAADTFKNRWNAVKAISADPMMLQAVTIGKGKVDSKARKILFFAIEHRLQVLCFLLCELKN